MKLKPIETQYNGYRFRSRMEARWAVYLDAVGIEYVYEPEGYDLSDAGWYLPDFWLPQVNMFAEVKPLPLTKKERLKCNCLTKMTGHDCLRLIGIPDKKAYFISDDFNGDYHKNIGFILTDMYLYEHRFYYIEPADEVDYNGNLTTFDNPYIGDHFYNVLCAIKKARSARFEHGETPNR